MIQLGEGCEYSMLIASFIETISALDEFMAEVYLNGTEHPLVYFDDDHYVFFDDGVKIIRDNKVMFLFYDTIVGIEVTAKIGVAL